MLKSANQKARNDPLQLQHKKTECKNERVMKANPLNKKNTFQHLEINF